MLLYIVQETWVAIQCEEYWQECGMLGSALQRSKQVLNMDATAAEKPTTIYSHHQPLLLQTRCHIRCVCNE